MEFAPYEIHPSLLIRLLPNMIPTTEKPDWKCFNYPMITWANKENKDLWAERTQDLGKEETEGGKEKKRKPNPNQTQLLYTSRNLENPKPLITS